MCHCTVNLPVTVCVEDGCKEGPLVKGLGEMISVSRWAFSQFIPVQLIQGY